MWVKFYQDNRRTDVLCHMTLERLVFDFFVCQFVGTGITLLYCKNTVTEGYDRGYAPIRPHVKDVFVMRTSVKQEVLEFIITG